MIILESIKMALRSIWANKARSFLTMLGIIIGISAVVVLISIGEGVKQDVTRQIYDLGSNLVIVLPGKVSESSGFDQNPANIIAGDILTKADLQKVKEHPEIIAASPLMIVSGGASFENKTSAGGIVIGADEEMAQVTALKIELGRRILNSDLEQKVVVLGADPKKDLFEKENPLGKKIKIAKEEFEVIGTLQSAGQPGIFGHNEFDQFIEIPFSTAEKLAKKTQIHRIIAKVKEGADTKKVAADLKEQILVLHEGEDNFSVLTQEELLKLIGRLLNTLTAAVSAIAAISLLVGGIGIMNIMLVTVTERTREIGLRKAVGATKNAILFQFLIEAVVVSILGAAVAVGLAFLGTYLVDLKTNLQPVITLRAVLLAVGVGVAVGVVFGLFPAVRAAQKDPIEALRYE